MRFVLSEYLTSLKEDGELDSFLKELIQSMGYIPLTKIQRGRQHGVDLPAIGTDEDGKRKLFLFVVKQGNFSRNNWDSGNINDIRPSITEILDVYIPTRIHKPYDTLPKKIIVCCNGELEQTVQVNWVQFVNKHTQGDIEFDFWGIQRLIDFADKYQLQEEILSSDLLLNFRRALSFIDLPDYNLNHLYKFLTDLLPSNEVQSLTDKKIHKKLRLVNLCMSIIHAWCKKSNNLKPAYIASERIILATYNWLIRNEYFERKGVPTEYYSIVKNWQSLSYEYLKKTAKYFSVPDGLSVGIGNHNEYCLVTFEQIGMVSILGLLELWQCSIFLSQNKEGLVPRAQESFDNATAIANILAQLIENNPASLNPRYDEHCIEINMALVLFYEVGFIGQAVGWLRELIDRIILNVRFDDFFPLFETNTEKLEEEKAKNQKSSLLCNFLAEWCLILRQLGYYHSLIDFLKKEMPDLNHQLWIPDNEVETYLYSDNASRRAGYTIISLDLPKNHLVMEMHIAEERVIMNEENAFSYNKHALYFMHFLASRHFRTYPFPNSWREYLRTNFCFSPAMSHD